MNQSRARITLKKWEIALTLAPALIWYVLVRLRSTLISPHCIEKPLSCVADQVFALDRFFMGSESPQADAHSFTTQYTAAWLAFLIPVALQIVYWLLKKIDGKRAFYQSCLDILIMIQVTLWNGVVTESIRLTVQRARPFVYKDPSQYGVDPAHYTSFVSGHSSFAATAGLALVLTLIRRQAPRWLLVFFCLSGAAIAISTAAFRVMAGRHFVTDTICGALSGCAVAFVLDRLHTKRSAALLTSEPLA